MAQPSRQEAASNTISFTEASTIVFENLPNLVTFGSHDLVVQWPSLEEVTVKSCPKIGNFGLGEVDISQLKSIDMGIQGEEQDKMIARYFKLSDILSSIGECIINDSEELSQRLTIKLKPSHYTNLETFEAKNCDERLNKFISILLERSEKLKQLTVKECKSLKHVFNLNDLISEPDDRGNGKLLPNLTTMKLLDLPQMNCIWNKDPTGVFGLGHLEIIEVMKCSSLKNLLSISVAEKLHKLRELTLHSCEKVEEIVATDDDQGVEETRIEFPQLSKLELMHLPNLIKFHSGKCALEFPSLTCLKISECPQMVAFTNGFASAEEEAEASTTDAKSFIMLSELELDSCGKLTYIIPSNILPRFKNLEKLSVRNCDSLQEIFPRHGDLNYPESMFSKLKELVLIQLSNLKRVISTQIKSTSTFESLEILRVKNCNSLEHLFLPLSALFDKKVGLKEMEISYCKTLKGISLIKEEKIDSDHWFSDLKCVVLENLPNLSTFSLGRSSFPCLEMLKVKDCPAIKTFLSFRSNAVINIILWDSSMSYKNLLTMTVNGCELLKEVFDYEVRDYENGNEKEILPQMSELVLNNLPNLENVWKKEPQIPVFQNLESLEIMDCDKLKSLFSVSTAKHLKKLKTLKLYGCKNMEKVFVAEDEIRTTEITFPTVECLILKDLPSLVSFCGDDCTFKWPKLRIVRVSNIPKMDIFCKKDPETPLLRTVYVTFIKKCWQGDLNKTIRYLHDNADH